MRCLSGRAYGGRGRGGSGGGSFQSLAKKKIKPKNFFGTYTKPYLYSSNHVLHFYYFAETFNIKLLD